MANSATFSVKNFEKFQHYKDRSPPWIRLYNSLLDDYEFGRLPDASKAHLLAIWLLASRYDNEIPLDPDWVGRRINATTPVDLDGLQKAGFIVADQGCSAMLAGCKQDAMPEERRAEAEERREEPTPPTSGGGAFRIETPARAPKPPYPEEFEALWRSYNPVASPNSTKADAHKAWAKLDEPTKAQCAEGLALYVAWLREEKQRRDGTKVKHLETFISKRGWEPFTERRPSAAATTVWVTDDDPRWPVAADRWRAEKGRPPPVVGGSQGNTGQGWHFPTDWLEPRAH